MEHHDFKFDWMNTTPMPASREEIEVNIGADIVPIKNYAAGLHDTLSFNAYQTVSRVDGLSIDLEDLIWYLRSLLEIRVSIVNGEFKDKRLLRELFIPSFFQMVLSFVGKVFIRDKGIELVPKWTPFDGNSILDDKGHITNESSERMRQFSNKLGYYERFIHLEKAAMPFSPEGEHDLMMTAVINDYVCSLEPVSHGFFTYVTGFLKMSLARETSFKVLYRVRYDDVNLIVSQLSMRREIFT